MSIDASRRSMELLIASGQIETCYHGRRRKVVYASLEAFVANLPRKREA